MRAKCRLAAMAMVEASKAVLSHREPSDLESVWRTIQLAESRLRDAIRERRSPMLDKAMSRLQMAEFLVRGVEGEPQRHAPNFSVASTRTGG